MTDETDTRTVMHRPFCTDRDNLKRWIGRLGDHMTLCRGCRMLTVDKESNAATPVKLTTAKPAPTAGALAALPARRWLACIGCGASIWLQSARARVPLCRRCVGERALLGSRKAAARARRRRERAELQSTGGAGS